MKLHTDTLTKHDIYSALGRACQSGKIADDIHFHQFNLSGSRSRKRGYEIQLGTYVQTSGPTKSRHYKNTGNGGEGSVWAASYDEWGWFIAELFSQDPDAIFGPYKSEEDFHAQTKYRYVLVSDELTYPGPGICLG